MRIERKRRDLKDLFSLNTQHCTAGDKDFERWTGLHEFNDERGCRKKMLEVIEEKQERFVAQRGDEILERGEPIVFFLFFEF
jgi:hypothetical protein